MRTISAFDDASVSSRSLIVRYCSLTAAVVSSLVMIGWIFDLPLLKRVMPNLPEMKVNTAVAFLILSAGLFFVSKFQPGDTRRNMPIVFGGLVSLIGLVTLGEYLVGSDVGIDNLIIPASATPEGIQYPGRMSPHSAFNFVILGISLALLGGGQRRQKVSEFLAILLSVTTFASVMGYLYGAEELYSDAQVTAMALHSAVLFIACSFALLSANYDSETGKLVTSDSLGGVISRRLIPMVVLVPLVIDLLRAEGEARGLFEPELGSALMQFTRVMVMVWMILFFSRAVHKTDIERRRLEGELAEKEQQFRDLFDYSQGMICIHSLDGELQTINPAARHSLGYTNDEMVGQNLRDLLPIEHRPQFAAYLREIENEGISSGLIVMETKSGNQVVWRYHNILVSEPDKEPYVLGHAQDVTELLDAQKQLKNLSLTDELTGLYNRRGFLTMAEQQIKLERHERTARGLTLMFADMDGLKQINDRFGHQAGSDAIIALSRIVNSALRSSDLIARWGGDEFVILTIGSHDDDANAMTWRISERIDQYNSASDKPYNLACSIGLAPIPLDGDRTFESIIAQADKAMYAEKLRRKASRNVVTKADEAIPFPAQAPYRPPQTP